MRTLKSFCSKCVNKILCLVRSRPKCRNWFACINCSSIERHSELKISPVCRTRIGRKPGDGKLSPCKSYQPSKFEELK
jgi:hypothetical protein